ncbi:uncharacterized protein DUF2585 [Stella humosa]|uniref:UPF0314 protein EDC65_4814 n=1 Tax=Stella humosa TaxID=94 RepID=A0A3N1KRR0_9PROT|nr:DUF2585 domain-containing protein [Stella humosa]ROP83281.1 uncharacterized protein DUF2585 [Stella humosa]BBK29936.1 UPF0314 protein [Stella humosa]
MTRRHRRSAGSTIGGGRWLLLALALVAAQVAILLAMGQPAICACGHVVLWQGDVTGPENSQQITDWYTPSHIIHGMIFYALARLVLPRGRMSARLLLAVAIEVAWEIAENSPPVIERYRQQALAQGYVGDSVLNSVFDTVAMALGFLLARLLPVGVTVALALALEVLVLWSIRDNLTLNVVQLVHPIEAVSRWQTGK